MLKTETAGKSAVLGQSAAFAASAAGGFILSGTSISGAASFVSI